MVSSSSSNDNENGQVIKNQNLGNKAAELKDDHSILINIKDKDCVAIEVQYHKSCYQQYTKFLSKPARPEREQNEPMFDVSYNLFCERIIRQRLLVNQEVLKMGQLRKTFIKLVMLQTTDTLKKRLTRDFPQLVFYTPTKRNICKLVFAETLSTETLVDMLPSPSGPETTQSSEMSQTDSETEKKDNNMANDSRGHEDTVYSSVVLKETPYCHSWYVVPMASHFSGFKCH
ncbi:hypothetical protein ACEWY4_027358 [Coilia grayii]|uniref:Uncharacterized protein n=1 Tax=Coilia grayii TaxID=363190 RepID=A0ABD1ISM2_9TELE